MDQFSPNFWSISLADMLQKFATTREVLTLVEVLPRLVIYARTGFNA
jgi:hypothetical protein